MGQFLNTLNLGHLTYNQNCYSKKTLNTLHAREKDFHLTATLSIFINSLILLLIIMYVPHFHSQHLY